MISLRLLPLVSAALFFAGCSTIPDKGRAHTHKDREFATLLPDRPGLDRLAQISPDLYRGAQPTPQGYEELRRMGVKTIISFRSNAETNPPPETADFEYVPIPIHASLGSTPPSDEQVDLFLEAVRDPAKRPAFMHCKYGRDRAGLMTALYRVEVEGWDNARAIEEMLAFGFRAFFFDLINFIENYRPLKKKNPGPTE